MTTDRPARPPVCVNVMLEQWSPTKAPGLGPMGNPLPEGGLDHQALSWAAYGWQTGVWRLLDLLADVGVPASFYPSGMLAEERPEVVAAIVAGGHEVCGHGWAQDVIPAVQDVDEERAAIDRATDAITAAGGVAPRGWISPRCTPSAATPELLAERGYEWFGDVFDTETPYTIAVPSGRITAFPFSMAVNDFPHVVRYGRPIRELEQAFVDQLAACTDIVGAHVDVTVHAHVGGRPEGLRVLRSILAVAASEGCSVLTRLEALRAISAAASPPA